MAAEKGNIVTKWKIISSNSINWNFFSRLKYYREEEIECESEKETDKRNTLIFNLREET